MTQGAEFPSLSIADSRRLLGPNFYDTRPGVVLEVRFEDAHGDELLERWLQAAQHLARELAWPQPALHVRRERGGAALFFTAPVDALMAATNVNEQAWVAAERGDPLPDPDAVNELRTLVTAEQREHANLAAVYDAAVASGRVVTFDDDALTAGVGAGAKTWPLSDVPRLERVDWRSVVDMPVALVAGSNGKTTTTRLVAAMWRAAGIAAGWCCSDGVWIDGAQVESGDYSGPGGARTVLRDPRVGAAVLEAARGGILRRGLAVSRADAAIITNISADHFGEYGIDNLDDLADAKAVVARALQPGGALVLNADDPVLIELSRRIRVETAWFSTASDNQWLQSHLQAGCDVAMMIDGRIAVHVNRHWSDFGAVAEMPLTHAASAHHNIQNLVGATLLGMRLGIPAAAIRSTLAIFGSQPEDNPGRLHVVHVGGATVLVDYAHNPEGLAALCRTASRLSARRRILILGQAGNRGDDQIRALPRAALETLAFDHVVIKELPSMLRGRVLGDVPRIFADELHMLGVAPERITFADSELAALHAALTVAEPGDLVVAPTHVSRTAADMWLASLEADGWIAGSPLPPVPESPET